MIRIEGLTHKYEGREEEAVNNINLQIKKGESLVVIGSSGSGKSTLLKCINRLIDPTSGKIYIEEKEILNCDIHHATKIRGSIGMIFQEYNLVESESVLKNVLNGRLKYLSTVQTLFGKFSKEDIAIAKENLKVVGLGEYENERVSNLSGGQKQRVAIARALSQNPAVILADEPVSSLDPKLMKEVMDLLTTICKEKGITLITSLHFLEFAKRYGTRIIGMKEGNIVFDGLPEELTEKDIVDIYGKTKEWFLYGKTGF
ncbi:phosphonate ABC transporter ATP-binding protein [Candidatus Woesearchaeota archaeon]|jgi:phosphonate transport system ATP-binding protein|nr:phosphonate ABC transporter ATP-binding protein [Candidatus Woesearchaeota archaeon]MBT4368839.1 phosphonate ABC transporter ATP-binding protein [Candidatus Woesearchaeota archaeon]MBT4712128.1 phosphonate ABC transporter ATP-binding protein [Candidatus Woesearchaeota archaeon]MBT6639124.1 phosphonate ABC transporter ATP-binding protein [Candidatus Woesearchaeota archaeon]MBT7134324.1 phosphonate ABC transporter ATP-binding protein [Candidatus Woesearchaeota archaeon]